MQLQKRVIKLLGDERKSKLSKKEKREGRRKAVRRYYLKNRFEIIRKQGIRNRKARELRKSKINP